MNWNYESLVSGFGTSLLAPHLALPPWELTQNSSDIVSALLEKLGDDYVRSDGVAVHRRCTIEDGAVLKGPAILGPDCFVAAGAYARGGCWLEGSNVLGPGCELKSSYLFSGTKLAHFNFVGDSILGHAVNLEAGSIIANYRNETGGDAIRIRHGADMIVGRKHVRLLKSSATIRSRPIGPSLRTFANAVAIVETRLDPGELLARLKRIEHKLGRRQRGQRWQARVIDLDIILWSGGIWAMPDLTVPHIEFRKRAFVLGPLADIAGGWRDPISGRSVRQLKARLDRKRPAA